MNEDIEFEELAPWLALLITLAGAALRLLLLGVKGMDAAETVSVWLAGHNGAELLQWVSRFDQHPPLYYFLLNHWAALQGDSPNAVRLLSALFGAGAIPLVYLTGKRLAGTAVGMAGATILALSPFHIFLAQEARPYTLLAFNSAAALYALVRLLTDARSAKPIGSQVWGALRSWRKSTPVEAVAEKAFSYQVEPPASRWGAWVYRLRWSPARNIETDLAWAAFIVFSAAALLSHYAAVFFWLATQVVVIGLMLFHGKKELGAPGAWQAPHWISWGLAQVVILGLCSPWMAAYLQQTGRFTPQEWVLQPTWGALSQMLGALWAAFASGEASQGFMLWFLGGLLVLGLVYYRQQIPIILFLATLIAIPFLGAALLSAGLPEYAGRSLAWVTVPLILLLAAGIAQLRFRVVMVLALGVFVTVYLFSTADYFRFYQKEDWSTPAGYVALFAQEGDLVLFNSNIAQVPFDYYFMSYEKQYRIEVEKRGVPLDLADDGIFEPKMAPEDIPGLLALVSGHNRVWLVYSHSAQTDPQGLIPQTLAAQMQVTRQRDFYGGQVQLYEKP